MRDPRQWPRPWLFGLLVLPLGIYVGFISTALPLLLSQAGLAIGRAFVWIEGKRNDWLSPSIRWDVTRDRLARNLDAVWQLAEQARKDF
jgi:hypothetical protein